jgi:hypothetical protein
MTNDRFAELLGDIFHFYCCEDDDCDCSILDVIQDLNNKELDDAYERMLSRYSDCLLTSAMWDIARYRSKHRHLVLTEALPDLRMARQAIDAIECEMRNRHPYEDVDNIRGKIALLVCICVGQKSKLPKKLTGELSRHELPPFQSCQQFVFVFDTLEHRDAAEKDAWEIWKPKIVQTGVYAPLGRGPAPEVVTNDGQTQDGQVPKSSFWIVRRWWW